MPLSLKDDVVEGQSARAQVQPEGGGVSSFEIGANEAYVLTSKVNEL
jgi:hypothetical protein